jgi:hypothetical protein
MTEKHHIYKIIETELEEVYKYGRSQRRLNHDATSPRANEQMNLYNRLAGWLKYIASILKKDIKNKQEAKNIENEYILLVG